MNLDQAWAEHTRQIKSEVMASVPRGVTGIQAEVLSVATPATDGRRYASVKWQGKTLQVLTNVDLTLAVGDLVVVHLYDTDPVLAYRITK